MGHAYVSKRRQSTLSSRDFQILLGLCVAVLSIAVVWLAARHPHPAAVTDTSALRSRVTLLEARLDTLQDTASSLATQTAAQLEAQAAELKRLRARGQTPALDARCLTQVQQEIDDIRGFIAFRTGIRKRVSAECTALLQPRFGG
jgi:hypothetical protein